MREFSEKQKKLLRGSLVKIAAKNNCSVKYVSLVVNGKIEGRDTELVNNIENSASELLKVLDPTIN